MGRLFALSIALLLTGEQPPAWAFLTGQDTEVTGFAGEQLRPAAAYSAAQNQFLVVFQTGSPDLSMWGQRTTRDGNPVGDPFFIVDTQETWPQRVVHSSNSDVFLLVWSDRRAWETQRADIYGQMISGAVNGGDGGGQFIGGQIPIAVHLENQRGVSVSFDTEHNQFLVVWHDGRDLGPFNRNTWICGRRLSGVDASLLGDEIQLTEGDSAETFPAVNYSPPDDSFLVVWNDFGHHIYGAQRVAHTGAPVGDTFGMVPGPSGVQGPAVSYAAGQSRFLVAYPAGDTVWGQLVSGLRNAGDGGSQLIGSEFALGSGSEFTFCGVDYTPDIGHWLAVWDRAENPYALRGCWVDTDGVALLGDHLISDGSRVTASHSVMGRDVPCLILSAGLLGPHSPPKVLYRSLPQRLTEFGVNEIERRDFLRVEIEDTGWNMIGALPGTEFAVDLSVFPQVRFFTGDPLAESDYEGHGRAEIIAVNGSGTGAETLNLLVEVPQYDPTTLRMEHSVSPVVLVGHSEVTGIVNTEGHFLDALNLQVIEGEHCVINVIPLEEDLDINLAVFQPGTVPVAQYTGLEDLPMSRRSYGTNPGRVETVYLVAPVTGDMGLAVWAGAGEGEYRLVVRDPDEPTTDELIAYLLGLASIPWGGDVNDDGGIDAADVVANIEAGR